MTREEIINAIRELATKLGRTPSRTELARMTKVNRREIRNHFATYGRALHECQLEKTGGGRKVPLETLFRDWAELVRRLKKIPTVVEYEELSKYSISPLLNRFKTWGRMPGAMMAKAKEEGWAEGWDDVVEIVTAYDNEQHGPGQMGNTMEQRPEARIYMDRPFYGPPLNRHPLAHGPMNENGVIFLFGAMARDLGFIVQQMRSAYPDCEAMREVAPDKWQHVWVELEQHSRNFLKHGHDISKCDLLICWEHNWPECPLEVIELKRLFGKQNGAVSGTGKPKTEENDDDK